VALLVLKIAGALVLLDFLVHATFARIVLPHFERKPKLRARSYPPVSGLESFEVTTPDGHTLRGSILRARAPRPAGVIVFCHEFGGSRWSFQGHCDDRVISEYDLVTFDFRNHGESDHDPRYVPCHWLTSFEHEDAATVLKWVQSQPDWKQRPIAMMGVSRGANAAISAAATATSKVAGVIAVGAFSTHRLAMHYLLIGIRRCAAPILAVPRWHIQATMNLAIAWSAFRQRVRFVHIDHAARSLDRGRLLFIAGGDDSHIPASFQQSLAAQVSGSQFWTVPAGRHNLERNAAPAEFDARVAEYLDRIASRPAISAVVSKAA